jgi:short-subunit dehydrogenase
MSRPTAFITGASSGIGAEFARQLAREGHDLVLHGRREQLLQSLCGAVKARYAIEASYVLGELSSSEGVEKVADRLMQIEDLAILVNCAGGGSTKLFHEEDLNGQTGMARTHVIAAMRFCHAAIPKMLRRGGGAIINVSSVAGFTPGKRNATYCAAKAFLTVFSEALHLELAEHGIRIQALCPGFTTTDFHARISMEVRPAVKGMFMTPERVVAGSLRDLKRGKVVSVPGWRYRAVQMAARVVPRGMYYWIARRASRQV